MEPRDDLDYSQGGVAVAPGNQVDWLEPGTYKVRLHPFGPWVPVEVWFEDGDRDPETWELQSDQTLAARWWPQTDSTDSFDVSPDRFINRARPIDRREFEWLIHLRTLARKRRRTFTRQ